MGNCIHTKVTFLDAGGSGNAETAILAAKEAIIAEKGSHEGQVSIITENTDGRAYLIEASPRELLSDWEGECNFVPANDASVFFAAQNGDPIDPAKYQDFETLLMLLKDQLE